MLDKAVAAAHTFFQANPDHVEMRQNLEYYRMMAGVQKEDFKDLEARTHMVRQKLLLSMPWLFISRHYSQYECSYYIFRSLKGLGLSPKKIQLFEELFKRLFFIVCRSKQMEDKLHLLTNHVLKWSSPKSN